MRPARHSAGYIQALLDFFQCLLKLLAFVFFVCLFSTVVYVWPVTLLATYKHLLTFLHCAFSNVSSNCLPLYFLWFMSGQSLSWLQRSISWLFSTVRCPMSPQNTASDDVKSVAVFKTFHCCVGQLLHTSASWPILYLVFFNFCVFLYLRILVCLYFYVKFFISYIIFLVVAFFSTVVRVRLVTQLLYTSAFWLLLYSSIFYFMCLCFACFCLFCISVFLYSFHCPVHTASHSAATHMRFLTAFAFPPSHWQLTMSKCQMSNAMKTNGGSKPCNN